MPSFTRKALYFTIVPYYLALPARLAAEFDNADLVEWARKEIHQENGPNLKVHENPNPVQLPLRNSEGTLFLPEECFPDSKLSAAVMNEVDAYLAVAPNGSKEELEAAFSSVSEVALRWAHSIVDPVLKGRPLDKIQALKAVQNRLIRNPAIPPFHEFLDSGYPNSAGWVSHMHAWSGRDGAWVHHRNAGNTVSMALNPSTAPDPFTQELYRTHEWSHIVDMARYNQLDDRGRAAGEMNPSPRHAFFTESKAFALSYLLNKSLIWNEAPPFQRFLSKMLAGGLYPWAEKLNISSNGDKPAGTDDARVAKKSNIIYVRTIKP